MVTVVGAGGAGDEVDRLTGGEFDDESGAGLAVAAVLHPHATVVKPDVLVDEGEAEPGALAAAPAAGTRTAGETLEDECSFVHRHAGAVVFDRDLDVGHRLTRRVAVLDPHVWLAGAIGERVVDEVGDHAGEAAAVAADDRPLCARRARDREAG